MNFLSKTVLGAISMISVFAMLQGCGGSGSNKGSCCQGEPPVVGKVKEIDKVVAVPEVKGDQIVYVDRNVTIIEYVDRNITVIKYKDRNVTVDVIKVRPEARITGLNDGAVLTGNTLVLDSVNSSDVDGNVTKYRWILDDSNISTEKNPTIDLPTTEGVHKLCLEVTDNDNLVSTMTCRTFSIPPENKDPMAVINIPVLNDDNKNLKTKCPFVLNGANSIATDSEITSYVWTIDDNQTLNGKDQNLSLSTIGMHKICLEVTDSHGLKNKSCRDIEVKDHVAPTAVLTVFDSDKKVMLPDSKMLRGDKYDFSCEGSVDDCNMTKPMTCEWNAHSYRIDEDGKKVDFVKDCMDHNGAPKTGPESWVVLCGSPSQIYDYKYIEVELKITDQFGKTATRTDIFEVIP
jgi:hypothetical protein